MKKVLFFIMFVLSSHINAQTILKGDMNDDNEVTIADVTSVVNVVLGKAPLETISAGCSCEPYQVDNSSVVGSWSTPDGTSFQFNEDGTTTFPGGATYEFMPMQGRLLVYDAENQPVKAIPILKVESEKILTVDYATNTFNYFTKAAPAVTYYFSVGTTAPTADNYTSFNDATQEIPTEPFDFTNTSGRRTYAYILVPENKTVSVTEKVLGGKMMVTEYTDVSIPNHKVYKTTAAVANTGTIVITLNN